MLGRRGGMSRGEGDASLSSVPVASLGPFQGPPLQCLGIIWRVEVAEQVVLDHGLDHIIRQGIADGDPLGVAGLANPPRPRFENANDRPVTLHAPESLCSGMKATAVNDGDLTVRPPSPQPQRPTKYVHSGAQRADKNGHLDEAL
jgi:hypothetical protein